MNLWFIAILLFLHFAAGFARKKFAKSDQLFDKQEITKVKVIDITMFNGEPIGLLRYYYLKEVVDLFFIVESLESFSGKRKGNYSLDDFDKYFDPIRSKMVVLKLDRLDDFESNGISNQSQESIDGKCPKCWEREEFQRNAIYNKIKSVMRDQRFVAIVADIDEIPNAELVSHFPEMYSGLHFGAYLHMVSLIYNFNWQYSRKIPWRKAFVVTDQTLNRTTSRKSSSSGIFEAMRRNAHKRNGAMVLPYAGFHCSYFMSVEQIQQKLSQFSHQEYNTPAINSAAHIQKCIKLGKNMFLEQTPEVIPYYGRWGYPWPCGETCTSIPGFEYFKFERANLTIEVPVEFKFNYPKDWLAIWKPIKHREAKGAAVEMKSSRERGSYKNFLSYVKRSKKEGTRDKSAINE